jgi:hypothetical protein
MWLVSPPAEVASGGTWTALVPVIASDSRKLGRRGSESAAPDGGHAAADRDLQTRRHGHTFDVFVATGEFTAAVARATGGTRLSGPMRIRVVAVATTAASSSPPLCSSGGST